MDNNEKMHITKEALNETKGLSLLKLYERADAGSSLAQFVLGERIIESDSSSERIKGATLIVQAINSLEDDFVAGELDKTTFIEIIAEGIEKLTNSQPFDDDYINEEIFRLCQNAYELDSKQSEGLIKCYENGIGCDKDPNRALELVEKRADNGDAISCAEVAASKAARGETIESAIWIQKALGSENIGDYPKLYYYLKMLLAENEMTDHLGNDIDYDLEKKNYDRTVLSSKEEIHALFIFTKDEAEKLSFANQIRYLYADAGEYVKERANTGAINLRECEDKTEPDAKEARAKKDISSMLQAQKSGIQNLSKLKKAIIIISCIAFAALVIGCVASGIKDKSKPIYYAVGNLSLTGDSITIDTWSDTYRVDTSNTNVIVNDAAVPEGIDEEDWKGVLESVNYTIKEEAGNSYGATEHEYNENATLVVQYSLSQSDQSVRDFTKKYNCKLDTNSEYPDSQTITLNLANVTVQEPEQVPQALIDAAVFHATNDVKRRYDDELKSINKTVVYLVKGTGDQSNDVHLVTMCLFTRHRSYSDKDDVLLTTYIFDGPIFETTNAEDYANGVDGVSCPDDINEELEILQTQEFSKVIPYEAKLVYEQ